MPPIDFTAAEVGALGVAAQLWQDAALEAPAQRALVKLKALGYRAEAHGPVGVDARLTTPEAAFTTLLSAITERRAVVFEYRAASTGQTTERRVEPWRLRCLGRAWYLAGFDRGRAEARVFRLSRIAGRVRASGRPGAYALPATGVLETAFAALEDAEPTRRAVLALLPGHGVLLRTRAVDPVPGTVEPARANALAPGRDIMVLEFTVTEALARELAGLGPAAIVLEPVDLRERVVAKLLTAWRRLSEEVPDAVR
jgi:proteasome accessory factor B